MTTRVNNRMIDGASVSVLDFGAVGDGFNDDTQALKDAIAYAAGLQHGATVVIPEGEFILTDTINVPYKVNISGVSKGNRSQTNENLGSVFIKAHALDAVVFDRNLASYQLMENILIEGHHPANTAGRGVVIQTQGTVVLKSCAVYATYDTCYHVGGGANFTYAVEFDDCYANTYTSTPYCYHIDAIDFRGTKILSDGGVTSFYATSNGDNWSLGNCRFEGFSSSGMIIQSQQGNSWGRLHIANTNSNATYGVIVGDVGSDINFENLVIDQANIRKPGSAGVWVKDTANAVTIRNAIITSYDIGIRDETDAVRGRTTIKDSKIFNCNTGIHANSHMSNYENVVFIDTQVTCIDHIGRTNGTWRSCVFDLSGDNAVRPTQSGQGGNFLENSVKNNIGYTTRKSGYIPSVGASPLDFAHGLAASPVANGSMIYLTPDNGSVMDNFGVQNLDANTVRVVWASGETGFGLRWEARLKCDF